MSITIRLWSKEDLKKIDKNEDPFLTTIFMNCASFGEEEIGHYPYELRKTYLAYFRDCVMPVKFHATDDKNAIRFLKEEYVELPITLKEEIIQHRDVEVQK